MESSVKSQSKKILSEIQQARLKIGSDDEKSHEAMHAFIKWLYNKCWTSTYDMPAGMFQTTVTVH